MSSIGASKGFLEIAKFGLYVSIPIVLMYTFAHNSKNLQKFMGNAAGHKTIANLFTSLGFPAISQRSYVVYPPEGPRPPPPEVIREMARKNSLR